MYLCNVKISEVAYMCFVLLCGVTLVVSLLLWRGATPAVMAVTALLSVTSITAMLKFCPWRSRAMAWILTASATLSLLGVILNMHLFTVALGGTVSDPVLMNFDAHRDWNGALGLLSGTESPRPILPMAYVAAGLIALFGRDFTVLLSCVSLCYPLAIAGIGGVAWFASGGKRRVATIAMVLTALMCYLYTQSTVFLKDVPLTMLMAVLTCLLARWRMTGFRPGAAEVTIAMIVAIVAGLLRTNMGLIVVAMAVVFGIGRRDNLWPFVFVALAGLLSKFVVDPLVYHYNIDAVKVLTADPSSLIVLKNENTAAWDNILGDYSTMPFYRKLLMLPLSLVVQFLLPFPWNIFRFNDFGYTMCVAHLGYTWYFAGALILYWLFTMWRQAPAAMRHTVACGVLLTIVTAWLSSGRVSRYCLPWLPMLLLAAASVIARGWRKSLGVWLAVFTVLLATTLIICYMMQHH